MLPCTLPREAIDLTGVTTNSEKLRMSKGYGVDIEHQRFQSLFISNGTFVPIVWNAFVSRSLQRQCISSSSYPGRVILRARDNEKRLQHRPIQPSLGIFLALVGLEAKDEWIAGATATPEITALKRLMSSLTRVGLRRWTGDYRAGGIGTSEHRTAERESDVEKRSPLVVPSKKFLDDRNSVARNVPTAEKPKNSGRDRDRESLPDQHWANGHWMPNKKSQ
ncbi:hypothetical protein EV368DRAFT_62565 [Lentinula lateritia]|nr:hypothetical protein EV368DRAFT_62565 [Lentinula lateritia]